MAKVVVPYEHTMRDLSFIYLAIGDRRRVFTDWLPAYRDIDARGRRVVWAKFGTVPAGINTIWVRDTTGERPVVELAL